MRERRFAVILSIDVVGYSRMSEKNQAVLLSELNEPILMRIGINAGDILAENNDVFGDCVNLAARLQGAASSGGIPNSRFVAYDSDNHILTDIDPCWPLANREITNFLNANT